jgi:hypothetical protein
VNVGYVECFATLTPGGSGGSGTCSIGNTALGAGKYPASATYGGDAELSPSRSAPASFTVSPATSKTKLHLSSADVTYGDEQVETLVVTVTPEFAGSTPTGTVTVTESTTTVCVITLASATGSCTLSADQLAAGTYELVATYGGDENFLDSVSADEALTVGT